MEELNNDILNAIMSDGSDIDNTSIKSIGNNSIKSIESLKQQSVSDYDPKPKKKKQELINIESDYESDDSLDVKKIPYREQDTLENRMDKISHIKNFEKRKIKAYKKYNQNTSLDELDLILKQQESQYRLLQSVDDYKMIINGGVWGIDQIFHYYPLFGIDLKNISYDWQKTEVQLELAHLIEDFQKKYGHISLGPEAKIVMLMAKTAYATNLQNKSKKKKPKKKKKSD